MTLPIIPSALAIGGALAKRLGKQGEIVSSEFQLPLEERLLQELAGQDTTAPADATRQAIPTPEQISATQVPIQPTQPIQEGGGAAAISRALGETKPREEFIQPQVPDLVSNLLGGGQIAKAPETVQTLNGIQEEGITGEAAEIPDAVAAEAPGLLERFGESARAVSGELATNPVLQDLIGQVAQALSAREPQSFPFQLATGIRESAQGRQQDLLRQAVLDKLAGREPDDRVDLNMLTLSPELRSRAQMQALGEIGAAADIQRALTGIPTEQERAAKFELTQAQIDATDALVLQRNLETAQILTGAGVGQQFDSTQLSLLRLVNDTANKIAAQAGGIQGVVQDPSGNTTFQFKNPDKYTEVFNNTRDVIINNLVNSGALPENARLLSTRPQVDAGVPVPDTQVLDRTTRPPDSVAKDNRLPKGAKFVGSQKQDGKTLWFYDTTGDGRADTAVRK